MTTARALAERLAELLDREHASLADFLVALADFDGRRAWEELGHASLFNFLRRELGLSKGSAHYRKTAAELLQKFPEVVEPLRDGRLCITSIVQLGKVLTAENCRETLPKFFHRSKRDAMAVAAALQPSTAAPHRDVVTKVVPRAGAVEVEADGPASLPLEVAAAQGEAAVQPVEPGVAASAAGDAGGATSAVQPVEPAFESGARGLGGGLGRAAASGAAMVRRDSADPVTADLSRLHVTVSRRFLEKLEAARAALSHTHPGANVEAILEAGLDLVLERHARRKGLVKRPRQDGPAAGANSRAIPAAVKRKVWIRDKGRCQWPLESGGICGSTFRVQFDHKVPLALGGLSTVKNVHLLCAFHNDLAARRVFGHEWMNQFTRKPGARRKRGKAPPRA